MNKNKKLIIISVILILIITGSIFIFFAYKEYKTQKMIDKGVEYLNKKEYEKATTTFDLVLDEKSNDKKASQLKDMINKYLEAKECFDNGDLEKANELISKIGKEDLNYKEFKEDLDKLKNKVNSDIKKNKEIDDNINKLRNLIKEEKYSDAKSVIDKLEKQKLSDVQSKQVSDLKGRVNSEFEKQRIQKEKAEAKAKEKESSNKTITPDEAIKIARNYAIQIGDYIPERFEIRNEDNIEYTVQAYDVVDNHTATNNWYMVNKKTGIVRAMF